MTCPKCKKEVFERKLGTLDYQLKCDCGFNFPWYLRQMPSMHITQEELDNYWRKK